MSITVTDASGRTVLASGNADKAGHLPDNARLFMKVFGDENGEPVGLAFWRYATLLSDTRIPVDGYRDERFALPADAQWPLHVETHLQFRIYPQWVTDLVQQTVPELPDPPIVTLNHLTADWETSDQAAREAP
ncbi:hypothetical protein [Saccharospirillum salsuginis]|uniref:Uncharacterized protein n=1 Tax=Saccharospirillum salsuginis TaxID=418750 RepID=A0A918NGM7_9GAMM|nr:hypothetical protein [Saccharospirillum salsuginis]GGX66149.1 hypothetical protein GCM10007392_37240 [Saccharospirillum salsuginis]